MGGWYSSFWSEESPRKDRHISKRPQEQSKHQRQPSLHISTLDVWKQESTIQVFCQGGGTSHIKGWPVKNGAHANGTCWLQSRTRHTRQSLLSDGGGFPLFGRVRKNWDIALIKWRRIFPFFLVYVRLYIFALFSQTSLNVPTISFN